MMNDLFERLKFVKVYLDNVFILLQTMEEHIDHIRHVALIVAKHGLKAKISKREFSKQRVTLLGHFVDKDGVQVDPPNI